MGLYIRDDSVRDRAKRLAERRKMTITQVVDMALRREEERDEAEIVERRRKIDALLAELDAEPDLAPGFTDKDLYDENGDPIL